MKKIFPVLMLLLLTACSQPDQESLDALYEAFDRNHDRLKTEFEEMYEESSETSDREEQLKIIYDKMLPRIEDFRRTIHNHTVTGHEHEKFKEDILTYIDSLETLVKLHGEFNRTFINYNPLGEDEFKGEIEEIMSEIEAQEKQLDERYENINETYEALSSSSS